MDSKHLLKIVGICGVVILEGIALYKGLDGTYLVAVIGAIAGIVGYVAGKKG